MILVKAALVSSLFYFALADTVSIFPVGFESDNGLAGEAVGVGDDGTTFVLSGTTTGFPVTITLVENPTAISEAFNVPSLSVAVNAACAIQDGTAVCEEVVQGGESTAALSVVQTLAFAPFAVSVTSGSGSVSGTTSASGSGSTTASDSESISLPLSATSIVSISATGTLTSGVMTSVSPTTTLPVSTVSVSRTVSSATSASASSSASASASATSAAGAKSTWKAGWVTVVAIIPLVIYAFAAL